jgi:hypothetical protein
MAEIGAFPSFASLRFDFEGRGVPFFFKKSQNETNHNLSLEHRASLASTPTQQTAHHPNNPPGHASPIPLLTPETPLSNTTGPIQRAFFHHPRVAPAPQCAARRQNLQSTRRLHAARSSLHLCPELVLSARVATLRRHSQLFHRVSWTVLLSRSLLVLISAVHPPRSVALPPSSAKFAHQSFLLRRFLRLSTGDA